MGKNQHTTAGVMNKAAIKICRLMLWHGKVSMNFIIQKVRVGMCRGVLMTFKNLSCTSITYLVNRSKHLNLKVLTCADLEGRGPPPLRIFFSGSTHDECILHYKIKI